MKKLLLSLFTILSLPMFAQNSFANYEKYEAENLALKNKTIHFLFLGDSITEFWKVKDPDFFNKNNYINRGISGQTTSQMLLRFQQDVINLKPKNLIILAGTNDIAENTGPISNENILDNIKSMVEIAQCNHIKVTLCSVLPAYDFNWKKGLNPAPKILALNSMLKKYAQDHNLNYVDYYSEMKDERNGLDPIYTEDEVHPNAKGYQKMEEILRPFLK